MFKEMGPPQNIMNNAPRKWYVVILGVGFAGLACAKRLEKLWGNESAQRVLLVNTENYFDFQPFHPEMIGASIELRHVTNPIRFVLRQSTLIRAEMTKTHLDNQRVEFDFSDGFNLEPMEAQLLVLALGSTPTFVPFQS